MDTMRNKGLVCTLLFALCLLFTVPASSHGGWGGYHHGGWGGYNHGWRGGWGVGAGLLGAGLLLSAPYYYNSYNNYSCPTVRTCNVYGQCWYQSSCY